MDQTQQKQQLSYSPQKHNQHNLPSSTFRKKCSLGLHPDNQYLRYKVSIISSLQLRNSAPIAHIHKELDNLTIYYHTATHKLQDLFPITNHNLIKNLHRQFIQLAIGLAKAGLVTVFDQEFCGILVERGQPTLMYYLIPENVFITQDRQRIEQFASTFSLQALNYLKNGTGKESSQALTSCASDRCFKAPELKAINSRLTIDTRMASSSQLPNEINHKNNHKCQKQSSLGKLSLLNRQFTQISARYQSRMTPKAAFPSFPVISNCGQSSNHYEQNTRLSDQSILYDSGNIDQLLSRTIAIALLSKKAQGQLNAIKDRMQPYREVLTILRNFKNFM